MQKIRVLIVDDAVVVRSRVSKILSTDPEIEVAGVAANGRIALAKIPHAHPTVIILDVDMPEMNGLETLAAIRQLDTQLPVIMFSTSTYAGATATLEALSLGASDYATKPSQLGDMEAANQHIREELLPKIKTLGSAYLSSCLTALPPPLPMIPSIAPRAASIEVIAIGVSTGGPNALATLLPELPGDLPVPLLIVQHMPPMFTKLLAERLTDKCQMQVDEAVSGVVLEPGRVWIAPGDFHLIVQQDGLNVRLVTHQAPPENSCRPSVDVLFRSIAQVCGAGTLAVVLTGMGQDGLRGCESIREVGGQVLVQDKASSVVWGMPGFVANAGLADDIVPLERMASEIMRRVRRHSTAVVDL